MENQMEPKFQTLKDMNKEHFNDELIIFTPGDQPFQPLAVRSFIGMRSKTHGYTFMNTAEDLQFHDPMRQDAFIKMMLPRLKEWYAKVKEHIDKKEKEKEDETKML